MNSALQQYDVVPPDPSLILESLRSIGYSFETAIADIIDNSISAGAKSIWFDTDTYGTYIMISDDGVGLSLDELLESMKLGSADPVLKRNKTDLGRFGLGLKLASFSHCRKLTVASKTESSNIIIRQWDLDYIRENGDWCLKQPSPEEYPLILKKLNSLSHGTAVYWENIDRFSNKSDHIDGPEFAKWYGSHIEKVNKHIEMVFHRFIDNRNDEPLNIYLPNGSKAVGWDPFLTKHDSVTELTKELSIRGIAVYPYIMPHPSKFRNNDEYKEAAGPLGTWARAQGFYVYRGKRLITAGSWLGLQGFTKSHETDLARIQLDISNSEDSDWMLDVKKSTVKIPKKYRKALERIAYQTAEEARKVRLYRGKINRRENPGNYSFLWDTDKNRKGNVRYKINRDHPFISKMLNSDIPPTKKELSDLLCMIEQTVPTQGIILEEMHNPDSVPEMFDDMKEEEIRTLLKASMAYLDLGTLTRDEKRQKLLSMEPFSEYEDFVLRIIAEEGI